MNWIEITIKTTSEGTEIITEVLSQAGINGAIIEDSKDIEGYRVSKGSWDYIDEALLQKDRKEVLVKGYLPDDLETRNSIKRIRNRIDELQNQGLGIDLGSGGIELLEVKEEDWANNWKKYFKPQKVGKRIVIKPSWEEYSSTGEEIVLELDPGMAFGTGTHETTILCIRALEEWVDANSVLLDVGCGTGILAISGLLLGAKRAIAIDLDTSAVQIAKENASINGVAQPMEVIHGNLIDKVKGCYSVIVANIIADVIIELSHDIKDYLTPGGVFIASGIILDRLEDVKIALKDEGLSIIDIKIMGEWAAVISRYE